MFKGGKGKKTKGLIRYTPQCFTAPHDFRTNAWGWGGTSCIQTGSGRAEASKPQTLLLTAHGEKLRVASPSSGRLGGVTRVLPQLLSEETKNKDRH